MPSVYLTGADWLGLEPAEVMMVAAHNGDLAAARGVGFRTAFVARPTEYGEKQSRDFKAEDAWDQVVGGMDELADRLGC